MSMHSGPITAVWLAFCVASGAAFAEGPNLGKPLDAAAIAAWDISIQPNGAAATPAIPPFPSVPWHWMLTAYILALNKLIGENDSMNAQTLPKVRMPNR